MKELGENENRSFLEKFFIEIPFSVRRMQFAAFTCARLPEPPQISPAKNQRPASPLAAPPPSNDATDNPAELELYKEYALLCLTNLGDCLILSIPELKRQLNAAAIRREDIK
jgi:lethal(2) giant larvae protein